MKSRKWTLTLAAILLIALMTTCYLAIAAEYGSKDDPLVTLSYINDVLAPEAGKKIDELFDAKAGELDVLIAEKKATIEKAIDSKLADIGSSGSGLSGEELIEAVTAAVLEKLESGEGGTGTAVDGSQTAANSWKVVKLQPGQSVVGQVGCEILLRIGSAQCVSSGTPGLINLSSGTDLANGGELSINNLYIVTVNGRGIKTSGGATVLLNGPYTIQ